MTTIAAIAAEALDAVALEVTDAVLTATIYRTLVGSYDAVSDTYSGAGIRETGRAVITGEAPKPDQFPAYVVGSTDQMFLLEGFTSVQENDTLTIGETDRTIMAVQDIMGAGSLFTVVAR